MQFLLKLRIFSFFFFLFSCSYESVVVVGNGKDVFLLKERVFADAKGTNGLLGTSFSDQKILNKYDNNDLMNNIYIRYEYIDEDLYDSLTPENKKLYNPVKEKQWSYMNDQKKRILIAYEIKYCEKWPFPCNKEKAVFHAAKYCRDNGGKPGEITLRSSYFNFLIWQHKREYYVTCVK